MLTLTIYYHIEFKNKDEAKKKCGLRWNSEKKQWYNKLEYKNVNDSINVDNILVFEDGCIVESGSHAKLMSSGGNYVYY